MLANGSGKARAQRNGTARPAQRWRLLLLSSGEHSLSVDMARAGKKANAGQEIRLADFDADAGAGMGILEAHAKAAEKLLVAKGWIEPGGDGRATQKPRLPGIGTAAGVYVFTGKVWEGDE